MSTDHEPLRGRILDALADYQWDPEDTDEQVADSVMAEAAPYLDEQWEKGRRYALTQLADHFTTAHDVAAQGRDLIVPPDYMRKRANGWMRYLRWAAGHVRAYAQGTANLIPTEADELRRRQQRKTLELQARVDELEKRLLGTLARRCSIPDCPASYDAVDGPPPEEQPPNRHWMLSPSPSLTLCPDHSHLWPTHRPRLDHTTRIASCECGHPLPGPTLGHMGVAWIAHALTVLEGENPLGVYWDKLVERDGQGGVYAFCTAWTGRPVYLAMREEDAEALAGSLLNTSCGCGHSHASHWGESASGHTECMASERCPCGGSDVSRGPRSPEALADAATVLTRHDQDHGHYEPGHCTDPDPHPPHEYADDTDTRHCTGTPTTAPNHGGHDE